MQVTTTSFGQNFLNQINQLENRQTQLQNEASSGLSMTSPEDNPTAMNQVLSLQTEDSANTQFQSNISNVQATADTSSDALNQLQSIIEKAQELATSANGVTSSSQLTTLASQVSGLITEALGVANTTDSQGNYIFAGTNGGSPAFTATTDADGNVTGVTYNGTTDVSQTEIGAGLTVSATAPGENNTGSGAAGVFSDSRTGANIFSDLISLQQNLASGNSTAVATTNTPALDKDEANVVSQISANGVMQSTLQSTSTNETDESQTMESQMSGDTSADLAKTLTLLSQTQAAYQASLESGVMVSSLSLMDYLQ
ncbi:MAG TPA: flagellar hook-associated protein FlgL [Verrucomicrobiae bacterium]|jgi:flagellar hook-associated protein 3 FlgL